MDKLKIVKITVALMTFLLILGTLLLLTVIYQKTRKPVVSVPAEVTLNQPEGTTVAEFKIEGDSVFLLLKNGGASDRLLIYNRNTGAPAQIIRLN